MEKIFTFGISIKAETEAEAEEKLSNWNREEIVDSLELI